MKYTDEGGLQGNVRGIHFLLSVVHVCEKINSCQRLALIEPEPRCELGICQLHHARSYLVFILTHHHLDVLRCHRLVLYLFLLSQDRLHRVPELMLEPLHVDLLADLVLIQHYPLIAATSCFESLPTLHSEHVLQVVLLPCSTKVAKAVLIEVSLFKCILNLSLLASIKVFCWKVRAFGLLCVMSLKDLSILCHKLLLLVCVLRE